MIAAGQEEIHPFLHAVVFAQNDGRIPVIAVRKQRDQQICNGNGIRRPAAGKVRNGIGDPAVIVHRIRDVRGEFREKALHPAIIDGLVQPRAEIVQPAETLVSLRAVRHDRMQIVRLRDRRVAVQPVQRFVRAGERPRGAHVGVHVFRRKRNELRFSADFRLYVTEAVIREAGRPFLRSFSLQNVGIRTARAAQIELIDGSVFL